MRDGLFCARPPVRRLLGAKDAAPSGCGAPGDRGERDLNAVRASFGAGTPEEHIDRVLAAVRELAGRGPDGATASTGSGSAGLTA